MKIRWPLLVRRTHKWLALVVGLQVVLWTATGFYMVVVHIDTIHGDHLVRPVAAPTLDVSRAVSPASVLASNPGISEMRLVQSRGRLMWQADHGGKVAAFDATTGVPMAPMAYGEAVAIAKAAYAGTGDVVAARLLTTRPQEMGSRKPPYWQVEFAGWNRPTLYLSPATGEVLAKRHLLWRAFDFAWMLHIMDYDARTNVNNPLLRVATWSAFAMATTGAWLLLWSFPRRRRKART